MQVKALYDNGHIIFLDKALPPGTMQVTVDIPDSQIPELSDEWKAELDRRAAAIDSGDAKLIPGEELFEELMQKYK